MDYELEQIGHIQKFKRRHNREGFDMPEPVQLPEGITDELMYGAFERVWKEINKDNECDPLIWLEHSDRWGERGYLQPTVHFDWLFFRKGVALGIVLTRRGYGEG